MGWLYAFFSLFPLFLFPEKNINDVFNLPSSQLLTEEHELCLINSFSYDKYYFFRKCYEAGTCPLCILPETVYPTLTDTAGKRRRKYSNIYWTAVVDTLAEREGRAETILIVRNIHEGYQEATSIQSASWLPELKWKIFRYLDSHYGEVYGTWHSYMGRGAHTIDPVCNHAYESFTIPDETVDVRIPVYKGQERQREIRERALGFAIRYESGEVPERFQTAS